MAEGRIPLYNVGDKVKCIKEFVAKPSKGFRMAGKLELGKVYTVEAVVYETMSHSIPVKGFWKENPDMLTFWNDHYLEYVLDKRLEEYM